MSAVASEVEVTVEAEKSVQKSVAMQPGKNGGMLRHGSQPGNTPGTGRPEDRVRRKSTEGHEQWIDRLMASLNDETLSPADVARFVDVLGKYGVGTKNEVVYSSKRTLEVLAVAASGLLEEAVFAELASRFARALMGKVDSEEPIDVECTETLEPV